MNNTFYYTRNKSKLAEMSTVMRDEPQQPLDRAVYWIEYIIRHKGAQHLQTASRKLNFLQRDHADVHFIIFLPFSVMLYLIAKSLFKLITNLGHRANFKRNKKKND